MADRSIRTKRQIAEALLAQPLLAKLATANAKTLQPHIVLVWFLWDGECLWISSFASTRKNRELRSNPRCAVLIEPETDEPGLQAVLLEGTAELVVEPRSLVQEMSRRIYTLYMGKEGVLAPDPQSWIVDPENTLIRMKQPKIIAW